MEAKRELEPAVRSGPAGSSHMSNRGDPVVSAKAEADLRGNIWQKSNIKSTEREMRGSTTAPNSLGDRSSKSSIHKQVDLETNGWKDVTLRKSTERKDEKGAKATKNDWKGKEPASSTSLVTKPEKEVTKIEQRGSSNQPKVSYLAAAASSARSTTAAPKPASLTTARTLPFQNSQAAVAQVNRKYKPSEILQIDLLLLALQTKRAEEEKKRQRSAHHPGKSASSVSNGAGLVVNAATGGVVPKVRGKVRGAGEQARRKNRLSSLKKAILSERKARWWLVHPETQPFPLVSHPALMEHDCVWLTEHQEGDRDTDEEDEQEEAEVSNAVDEEVDEGDECSVESGAEDEDGDSSTEREDEQEKREGKEQTRVVQDDHMGTVRFDPAVASPVYFGASFKRQVIKQATEEVLETEAAEKKRKDVDTKVPPVSLSRPVRDYVTKKKKDVDTKVRPVSLSRPVRDYVTQALSKEFDTIVLAMLSSLFKFQERARLEDPIKAKLRRRLILGLHEVRRGVRSRKCIAVVIAPNVEDLSKLDEKIDEILSLCLDPPTSTSSSPVITTAASSTSQTNQNRSLAFGSGKAAHVDTGDVLWEPIPVIFASSKRSLGHALGKRAAVSCVGIYSADGAHEAFKQCLSKAQQLGEFWKSQVELEKRQAMQGKRPTCGSCHKPVLDLARRDCLKCALTYCESCVNSRTAKKKPCPATPLTEQNEEDKLCNIVRVARTLPPLVPKTLSVAAREFVPAAAANTSLEEISEEDEEERIRMAIAAAVPKRL